MRRVHDFGMELHAEDGLQVRLVGRDGAVFRGGRRAEARGQLRDVVAVAHPYRLILRQPQEQLRGRIAADRRGPVLPLGPVRQAAAVQLRQQLVPEADAEDRIAVARQPRAHHLHVRVGHRLWPAGEDQARRRIGPRLEILGGQHDAIDAERAHAVRDQVRVLAAEIEDGDAI